jgi:phosphoribosylglycinamide formyltransferase, formyltetrahydrofolate-dependent
MRNIAIFASGSGTNAENIIKYFSNRKTGKVTLVLSNKHEAYVLRRAAKYDVKSLFFEHTDFYGSDKVLDILLKHKIDFVVLAGFMLLIPENILNSFSGRIVNIHPAILPKYGGKGMYGEHVHKAVLANNEDESGITIHYVNRFYDEGNIIFQAKCRVMPGDTPESLASRVHELEYAHFPEVIENLIKKLPERIRK